MDTAAQVTEAHVAPPPAAGARYTLTAQALHWVTGGLMFVVLPLAWVMVNMGRDNPDRGTLFTLHKSVGLTILALVAVRLLWRRRNPAPALRHTARWEALAARASHWMLYTIMIGMPVSGYLLSAGSGRPVNYFGLFSIPGLPKNETVDGIATWLHVATGQWAVYALILLHLSATAWHVAVRRDGLMNRMLPAQEEGA